MRTLERVAVMGATGPTGAAVTHALLARGVHVRVMSRSESHLAAAFGDTSAERIVADAADAEACARAIDGCDTVFNCIGVPMSNFKLHLTTTHNIVDAASRSDAAIALITGYWFQAPHDEPISKSTPEKLTNPKSTIRFEQESMVRDAGGLSIVLPDFYGPGCAKSFLNDAIRSILKGEKVLWPGNPESLRDFVYVPDVGEPAARLAEREDAFGERWVIAGSGALTPASLCHEIARMADATLRLKMISSFVMKLASFVRPDVQPFMDVAPIYREPATFDDSDTRALIGDWPVTSYDEGLSRTIEWIRSEEA